MIVADTMLLVALWVPSRWTPAAERLLVQDSEWAVPLAWRDEFHEVLGRLIKRGAMTMELARKAVQGAERLVRGREYAVPSGRLLEAVSKTQRPPSDCAFVLLAEDLGVPFFTVRPGLATLFPAWVKPLPAGGGDER